MPRLDLYQLPRLAPQEQLADATVIVVDLLRASTTIATALAAGAECVMPFAEIDETLAAAEEFGRPNVLLGGERGGRLIPGFELGNSPAEYTPVRVAGRRILFTTTNGARALHHARHARRVLVGAAVNRFATALQIEPRQDVVVLCAGTDGVVAREDQLAGGAIIEAIRRIAKNDWTTGDDAVAAYDAWLELRGGLGPAAPDLPAHFAAALRDTDGGRNLIAIDHADDLLRCAQLDTLETVPVLEAAANELRPA